MRLAAALALAGALMAPSARAEEPFERPVNLWPLYYRRASGGAVETEALFWLYARTETPTSSTTKLRPLFRHDRAPGRLSSRFFPLYDYRRDGRRASLGLGGLTPFTLASFDYDEERPSARRRVLLWRAERDPASSLWEFPPLWAAARGPGGRRRVSALGLPDTLNLFESLRDPAVGLFDWHALSVWSRRSPDDRYLHVWPFFGSRLHGTRQERSVLWPLAVKTSDPARGLTALRVWPLFATRDAELDDEPPPDLDLNMVLPVPLWYRASARGSRHRRLFYLHWDAETPKRRVNVTPPYYRFEELKTGVSHRGFFPLYHRSDWDGRSFTLAPPLFVSWRDEPFSVRMLFPLYYGQRDGDREFEYYFPLYGRSVRGGKVTRRFLLFPLYARRSEPESGLTELDVLWPLVHVERSSETASTRLLPLYWSSRRGADSFALAPLYARLTRGEETSRLLFPVYWAVDAPGRTTRIVPPLGGLVRDGNERDFFLAGFAPKLSLFERERRPDYALDRALLAYRRREPGSLAEALFPLYFRWDHPGERGLVVFPLWASRYDRSDGSRHRAALGLTGGFSLFEWSSRPADGARSLRALVFHRSSRGADSATVFFPLYWRFQTGGTRRTWLFPLYAGRRGPGLRARGFLGFSPRWSLLSRTEDGEAVETRFLWRLVRIRRAPGDSAFEANPFFFTLREGPRRYSAVLGGLVGRESGPDGTRWRWLWAF
jgi:hypothetical protein